MKQLRYGHLMIMTDQDHDGSHIKGLIMNFFHHFYPSLLKLPGFLLEFITPIVKVIPDARTEGSVVRMLCCGHGHSPMSTPQQALALSNLPLDLL